MGAVTPVPMGPTYQTLGLAVREPMRLEGTNVVCTHTSLCMVAIQYLHSTIKTVLHAPGISQSHIRLFQTAFDTSQSVSQFYLIQT